MTFARKRNKSPEFLRASIHAERVYAIARSSVCLSVRLSHGWISQQEPCCRRETARSRVNFDM